MTTTSSAPTLPVGSARLFQAGAEAKLDAHLDAYGPVVLPNPQSSFTEELERSGLIGRGGAGFPAWRKLSATARNETHGRNRAVVIANGAEGEPRSRKDATLLRHSPHLVLDGLLIACSVLGATESYLYASADGAEAISKALLERVDARQVSVVVAENTFISGEASAVVNAIANGKSLPTDRIRRLSEKGLHGKPTLVFNVETLAHIALISRFGAEWFRSVGTERDPGTRLTTISGDVPQETVLEIAGDTTIRELLDVSGVPADSLQAVLVGGYHGVWVPASDFNVHISPAGLRPFDGHPGAGIVYALGTGRCPLSAAATIVTYLGEQSARQCGPCMFGLPAMGTVLTQLAERRRDASLVSALRDLAQTVQGRGSCHHPDGTARFVKSALTVFKSEVDLHVAGSCSATPQQQGKVHA